MRRRWVVIWVLIVGALGAVEIGIIMGLIIPDPLGSVSLVLLAITIISILSIIGAVFVGMFASHRILSATGFTPFEQEMLRMREDLHELQQKIGEIATRLGLTIQNPKNPP